MYVCITSFCCLIRVMIPLSQFHVASPPPVPVPLDHTSSLPEPVGLPFFLFPSTFTPFLLLLPTAVSLEEGSDSARFGTTGGVWAGSMQAKEQRFLMILAVGLGERSLQRSSNRLNQSAASL